MVNIGIGFAAVARPIFAICACNDPWHNSVRLK